MSLQAFSFPFPETRFIRAASLIYKFKIRAGSSYSGGEMMGGAFSQELEDIIRTVLGNLDILQPFSSTHFNVFPYKKHWEGVSKVMCQHGEKKLRAYPFILIVYLEKNTQNENQVVESTKEISQHHCEFEPQSKRYRRDPPLEYATVKDLAEDMETESKASVAGQLHMDNPHTERKVKEGLRYADEPQASISADSVYGEGGQSKRVSPEVFCHLNSLERIVLTAPQHQPVNLASKPTKVFSESQVLVPGSGSAWDEGVEQEEDEEGENSHFTSGTPVRSGILTQLASNIFPFSWFFRDP